MRRLLGTRSCVQTPIDTPSGKIAAVALAPVGVIPVWQRLGVGSALIRLGLERCRERECTAVIVLGHPDYYARFGFSAELATRLVSAYGGPAFMALELVHGSLSAGGIVHYPAAFSRVN